jgi:hypothetical protein
VLEQAAALTPVIHTLVVVVQGKVLAALDPPLARQVQLLLDFIKD